MPLDRRPWMLLVLDGWGWSPSREGNAVALARLPYFRHLEARYPHTLLRADGEWVGLMEGQMGNSNVGHLNLGAGRVVYQDLVRVFRSIRDGSFFRHPLLLEVVRQARRPGQALHLMGLLSDGGVHSHQEHLYALLEMAGREGIERVFVHAFTDGRDTPPTSGAGYMAALEARMASLGVGRVATVSGRYWAMDRDRRWERTERAYRALVVGEGEVASSGRDAVARAYARGEADEFITPTVVRGWRGPGDGPTGDPVGRISPGDGVIFFNFRADRARQLSWALAGESFDGFARPAGKLPLAFCTFTRYDEKLPVPCVFPPQDVRNTLGEVWSRHGLRQLRIAETEKYAHVTYFFNGGREEPFPGESRRLIPSPRVSTYDRKPEMSAPEVTSAVLEEISKDVYDCMVLNYANPDMVGHTGVTEAATRALEVVDGSLARVIPAVLARGGVVMVLGDHGNVEQMLDEDGGPHTAHTSNPVPFILVDEEQRDVRLREGGLADVAPTLLTMQGLPIPPEMDGHCLLAG
ncbi:MAG: 2,3-bisphosphoglycerate-independent phosphoglycerate mutase [Bacillota bacterium]